MLFLSIFFISLYMLVFQGFGFPSISPFWNVLLRIVAAGCIQCFFLGTRWPKVLKGLPLFATGCLALWACWMYLTIWKHTSFLTLTCEFLSPVLICTTVLLVYQRRGRL